ncbi:hypothetical protein GCM10009710_16170 [Aeromicrobium alkaliterrae]|uniref:Uncharacterized protein n=1 Tax=Aeromicrobium alkaliterrae TaxID=302168 RepID=A0ABP4VSK3_9ACTN
MDIEKTAPDRRSGAVVWTCRRYYGRCTTPEDEPFENGTADVTRNASFMSAWFFMGLTSLVVRVTAG